MATINRTGFKGFASRAEFEVWLGRQPHEWGILIAVRMAMRVLPAYAFFLPAGVSEDNARAASLASDVFLPSFRSAAIAGRLFLTPPAEIARNLLDGANAAFETQNASYSSSAYSAAYSAARTTTSLTEAYTAARAAIRSASRSASASASTYSTARSAGRLATWSTVHAIENDLRALMEGESAKNVASLPLWPDNIHPDWVKINWRRLSEQLSDLDEDWDAWIDWYEGMLNGRAIFGLNQEAAWQLAGDIAMIESRLWRAGPAQCNAEIKRLVRAAQAVGNYVQAVQPLPAPAKKRLPLGPSIRLGASPPSARWRSP